jgi:hypothetical protein
MENKTSFYNSSKNLLSINKSGIGKDCLNFSDQKVFYDLVNKIQGARIANNIKGAIIVHLNTIIFPIGKIR